MKAFLGVFDILPGFLWALLLAGALAFGGVQHVRVLEGRAAVAEARADLADYKAAAAESARLAARAALAELQRITEIQRKAIDEATDQTHQALADRTAADAISVQLRKQIDKLRTAIRSATDGASTAQSSTPTGDPIGVLADVLERADRRAGILAAYADSARIAGQLCERSYDALAQHEAMSTHPKP